MPIFALAALMLTLSGIMTVDHAYERAASARMTEWHLSAPGQRYARCQTRPVVNGLFPAAYRKPECPDRELDRLESQRARALDVSFTDALAHLDR